MPLSSKVRQMRHAKIRRASAGSATRLSGPSPYNAITLSREIVRQWLRPVSRRPPALDAREQPLDAGAVRHDLVVDAEDFRLMTFRAPLSSSTGTSPPRRRGCNVGLVTSPYRGSPLSVLRVWRARRRSNRNRNAVARAGIVGELQLRRDPRRARAAAGPTVPVPVAAATENFSPRPRMAPAGFRQGHLGQFGDESILRSPFGELVAGLFKRLRNRNAAHPVSSSGLAPGKVGCDWPRALCSSATTPSPATTSVVCLSRWTSPKPTSPIPTGLIEGEPGSASFFTKRSR